MFHHHRRPQLRARRSTEREGIREEGETCREHEDLNGRTATEAEEGERNKILRLEPPLKSGEFRQPGLLPTSYQLEVSGCKQEELRFTVHELATWMS